jgi:predicted nucleic acid-binding protein
LLPALETQWIDKPIHTLATVALLAAARRKLSLVDCSSFAMMRQTGTRIAFAFDQHLDEEGFGFPVRIEQ